MRSVWPRGTLKGERRLVEWAWALDSGATVPEAGGLCFEDHVSFHVCSPERGEVSGLGPGGWDLEMCRCASLHTLTQEVSVERGLQDLSVSHRV